MKNTIITFAVILFCKTGFAQGIEFEHGTFAEALDKAKTTNKMVFMDCYTSWCGPCKKLAKNVFPLPEVGEYFNQHFVSIKMDMEKGEGIELAKKYEIKNFPTLLFMNPEGNVLHKRVGATDGPGLINTAKITFDPSKQIDNMHKRYETGERNVEFLSDYVKILYQVNQRGKIKPVGENFLKNTPVENLGNVNAFTVLSYSNVLKFDSPAYKYIIENKEKIIASEGISQSSYESIVGKCIKRYLNQVASSGTYNELQATIEDCKKDFVLPNQEAFEGNLMSTFYISNKEFDTWFDMVFDEIDELLKKDKTKGGSALIQTAYQIAVSRQFEEAEGIYEKAIDKVENYLKSETEVSAGYFCLATLYWRMGNKESALMNIDLFIAKEKEQGKEIKKRTKKFKEEIEAM